MPGSEGRNITNSQVSTIHLSALWSVPLSLFLLRIVGKRHLTFVTSLILFFCSFDSLFIRFDSYVCSVNTPFICSPRPYSLIAPFGTTDTIHAPFEVRLPAFCQFESRTVVGHCRTTCIYTYTREQGTCTTVICCYIVQSGLVDRQFGHLKPPPLSLRLRLRLRRGGSVSLRIFESLQRIAC